MSPEGDFLREREGQLKENEDHYQEKKHAHINVIGGRTNNIRNFYECAEGERIVYRDIVSLYPYVLSTKAFPVGHPKVVTQDFYDENGEFAGQILRW